MTNSEFIRSHISDVDLASLFAWNYNKHSRFVKKIIHAHRIWAESASTNTGNMAKGTHGSTVIEANPSIWYWENWAYPDGSWRRMGRTNEVSFQVWLTMQYNPAEWDENNEE